MNQELSGVCQWKEKAAQIKEILNMVRLALVQEDRTQSGNSLLFIGRWRKPDIQSVGKDGQRNYLAYPSMVVIRIGNR